MPLAHPRLAASLEAIAVRRPLRAWDGLAVDGAAGWLVVVAR